MKTEKVFNICGENAGCINIKINDKTVTLISKNNSIQISKKDWDLLKTKIKNGEIE